MSPELFLSGLVAAAIAISLGALLMSYNRLVTLSHRCDEAFADIDVYIKQRHDLVPNLVETVRGFVTHERQIIDSVTKARAAALTASTEQARRQAESHLGAQITQMISVTEQYPQIHGSDHFRRLREEISDCDNKIAASRRFHNMAVREYNASREQMPARFVARFAGHGPREFFDLGVGRVLFDEPPAIKF
jgi:LemA protein